MPVPGAELRLDVEVVHGLEVRERETVARRLQRAQRAQRGHVHGRPRDDLRSGERGEVRDGREDAEALGVFMEVYSTNARYRDVGEKVQALKAKLGK